MNQLYNNIRKIRVWNDLTQQNVADELNITQKHYSRIELGQVDISVSMLEKLAGILHVEIHYLFGMKAVDPFNIIKNVSSKERTFQPYLQTDLEQIKGLYERLLKEKDEKIVLLQSFVKKK